MLKYENIPFVLWPKQKLCPIHIVGKENRIEKSNKKNRTKILHNGLESEHDCGYSVATTIRMLRCCPGSGWCGWGGPFGFGPP